MFGVKTLISFPSYLISSFAAVQCSLQHYSVLRPSYHRQPLMIWYAIILVQHSSTAGTSMGAGIILPSVCSLESQYSTLLLLTPLLIGDVWWLDRASAFRENLAFVNEHNRVIIKVDNVTSVPFNEKRNSVIVTLTASVGSTSQEILKNYQIRITSQDWYAVGSLWIIDLIHLPYGCSVPLCFHHSFHHGKIIIDLTQVWPAFWSKGPHWPDNGEIDTIEGVNLMVCFSPSPTPTSQSAEASPGRESVCSAHAAGMFAASRCTTNRCARRNRLFATEWMFCFRVEPQQLRRRLCYSWRWGLGHTIRRGWYFVRLLGLFVFSTHDVHGHHSIWFWSVRTLFDPWRDIRRVLQS